jgi:hypothetical protein
MSAGTIFIELDLDSTKYRSKMAELTASANSSSLALETNFQRLGGKSDQMYQAMRQSADNAYKAILASAKSTDAEKIRAHQLYAQEVKRIDDEMSGRMQKNIGKINVGWMTMIKGAIVFRAAMASIHLLYESTIGSFQKGIESINQMKLSTASLASAFATNDPSLPFEKAYKIAGGVVERIQEMDRAFVGTASELQTLVDAWATYGGAVDFSTEKTRDQFVVFGNIIKLMTRGQDFQRQAMQEVRALMEGQNVQGALLLKKLIAMEPKAQAMIPIWREQGTLIENINRIMKGYVEGSKEIENTLEAQKASLSTITYKILREAMAPAYEDIKNLVRSINDYLLDENGLTKEAISLVNNLKFAWEAVKNTVLSVVSAWIVLVGVFKAVGTAIGGAGSVLWDALTGKFIDYSVWDEVSAQIDATTAALKRLSDATTTTKTELQRLGEAQASFYGYDMPEVLKTKGGKGKGEGEKKKDKSAEMLEKSWMDALENLSITFDDFYGTQQDAALEFTNYMIEQDVKMLAEREKLYTNDLGKWLEWQEEETNALVSEAERQAEVWEENQKKKMQAEKELKDWVINGFNEMADTLAEFVTTGKFQFRDFIDSVIGDLTRLIVKIQMYRFLGGIGFGEFMGLELPFAGARAMGGPVYPGASYLVGERGPEIFTPAMAGNISTGGGKLNVSVNVINESGVPMKAEQRQPRFDGQGYIIDVVMDGINRNVRGMRDMLGR